jgi:hypothetical protein
MRYIVFFILVLLSSLTYGQYNRQLQPVYIPGTAYKNTGWFVSPGITYMLPLNRKESLTEYLDTGEASDTLFSGDFSRSGKIGAYLEFGRHKFFTDRRLLKHIDYGVHFKMLRGCENFSGIVNRGGAFAPVVSDSKFSDSYVGGFFNASSFLQLTNKHWIQNSLGVNADVRVITRHIAGTPYGADWQFPSMFLAQFHYKLGFGWKPEPGIYIIPSIETPILNVFPWDDGKSTLQYFTGRQRPFIITLKIQWLSKAGDRRCEGQPGQNMPDLEKKGKHDGNDLWGPQEKKMKRKRRKM